MKSPTSMFKKPFTIKSQYLLAKTDKKKIQHSLSVQYPLIIQETLQTWFPLKSDIKAIKITLANNSDTLIYTLNDSPILFELDTQLYPSLYTLWSLNSLETLQTTFSAFNKIVNGADLMLPGVSTKVPVFEMNQVMGITLEGSPIFAVGNAQVSSREFAESGFSLKGKAITVMHCFGDYLWDMGSKYDPKYKQYAHTSELSLAELDIVEKEMKDSKVIESQPSIILKESYVESNDNNLTMDQLLDRALLKAIKYTIQDYKEFPISCSTFYTQYVLPSRPIGSTLDLKQSTHKKVCICII